MKPKSYWGILVEYTIAIFAALFLITINKTEYGLYDWQTYAFSSAVAFGVFVILVIVHLIVGLVRKKKAKQKEMGAEGHIKELKRRLLTIIGFAGIVFLALYFNANPLMERLFEIGNDVGYKLVYISPQEILVQQLRVAGVTSIIISLPIITYEIAAFCLPALDTKYAALKIFFISVLGLGMFIAGLMFADKILLPFAYKTLFSIGVTANVEAMVSVENYVTFFITFMVCMGVIFEMPLLSIIFLWTTKSVNDDKGFQAGDRGHFYHCGDNNSTRCCKPVYSSRANDRTLHDQYGIM